jgi:ABC-type glycerol-3-phosphate transport system substrate-binding protein
MQEVLWDKLHVLISTYCPSLIDYQRRKTLEEKSMRNKSFALFTVFVMLFSMAFAVSAQDDPVVVEFWTTDNEENRVNVYEAVADAFMAENPGIEVRIVPIDEGTISQRVATAVGANRLPDIIRMGVERVSSFAADGLLDMEAATATIQSIGEDDFRNGPLGMVTDPKVACMPQYPMMVGFKPFGTAKMFSANWD